MKKGFWLVTTISGDSRRFDEDEKLVKFIRKHCGCIVSWIDKKKAREHWMTVFEEARKK